MHADSSRPVLPLAIGGHGESVQSLGLADKSERTEGIAYSPSGNILAVATSDTNTVYLYRRKSGGRFETTPSSKLSGPESRLNYPHDIAFASCGNDDLMAVAQRAGAITVYRRNDGEPMYGPAPVWEISGPQSKLKFSDGVAFVPPHDRCLAVCNLETSTISFYRQTSASPVRFALKPAFQLRHPSVGQPDGLGFSRCGRWLAIANHGKHTVSIFRRRPRLFSWSKVKYGPRPVTVLDDPSLRYPHSVAFTPETNHLVVTNAGANYFSVYEPMGRGRETRWSRSPVAKTIVGQEATFREVNARNKMEGGPKGIAIHSDGIAVCSPEHGVKIFALHENANGWA